MPNYFECKVKYEKRLDDGQMKKVSEPYLVDAFSFTEAEERIIEEVSPFMTGEFEVSDIKKVRYAEIFECANDHADRFFKAKLSFITLDEKSGKEKKTTQFVLIQAADLRDSLKKLEEGMKGSMLDYTINSIAETLIVDIVHHELKSKQDEKPEYVAEE